MARALLAAGARLDARLRADREPLGPALVSTLSGCGQDWFRLLRRNGATPLHIAAVANASEAVGVLLEGGADPDVADATSATPLHYAAAAVLAARGADVSAATAKGVTPLHAAARRDAVPVVRVLLEHGGPTWGRRTSEATRRCIGRRRATRRRRRPFCSTGGPTRPRGPTTACPPCTSSTTGIDGLCRRAARLRAEGLPLPWGDGAGSGVRVARGAEGSATRRSPARIRRPGVALGLAATGEGGDVLLVEAAWLPGRGTLRVTGTVGPMTRESANVDDDVGALARRAPRRRRQVRRYDGRARAPGRGRPVEGRPVGGGWRWPSPWSRR